MVGVNNSFLEILLHKCTFLVSTIVTDTKKITFGDFGDFWAIFVRFSGDFISNIGFSIITVNLVDFGSRKTYFYSKLFIKCP